MDSRVRVCADTAQRLIENGAEISMAEEAAEGLGRALGADRAECFALPTGVMVSLGDREGHVHTEVRRIRSRVLDLHRMVAIRRALDEACGALTSGRSGESGGVEAFALSLDTAASLPAHSALVRRAGAFLAAGAFALLFGGGWMDGLAAGVIGLAWQSLKDLLVRTDRSHLGVGPGGEDLRGCPDGDTRVRGAAAGIPEVFHAILGGFLVILASGFLGRLVPGIDAAMVGKGGLMLLVPGLAFVQAVRELVSGQLVSSVSRFADVGLTGLGIAGGGAIALEILSRLPATFTGIPA